MALHLQNLRTRSRGAGVSSKADHYPDPSLPQPLLHRLRIHASGSFSTDLKGEKTPHWLNLCQAGWQGPLASGLLGGRRGGAEMGP